MLYGVDVLLHRPALYHIFSHWVGIKNATCLFSVHNTISLSRHEEVYLMVKTKSDFIDRSVRLA